MVPDDKTPPYEEELVSEGRFYTYMVESLIQICMHNHVNGHFPLHNITIESCRVINLASVKSLSRHNVQAIYYPKETKNDIHRSQSLKQLLRKILKL